MWLKKNGRCWTMEMHWQYVKRIRLDKSCNFHFLYGINTTFALWMFLLRKLFAVLCNMAIVSHAFENDWSRIIYNLFKKNCIFKHSTRSHTIECPLLYIYMFLLLSLGIANIIKEEVWFAFHIKKIAKIQHKSVCEIDESVGGLDVSFDNISSIWVDSNALIKCMPFVTL